VLGITGMIIRLGGVGNDWEGQWGFVVEGVGVVVVGRVGCEGG